MFGKLVWKAQVELTVNAVFSMFERVVAQHAAWDIPHSKIHSYFTYPMKYSLWGKKYGEVFSEAEVLVATYFVGGNFQGRINGKTVYEPSI